jgi:hypothetical protein
MWGPDILNPAYWSFMIRAKLTSVKMLVKGLDMEVLRYSNYPVTPQC